MCKSFRWGTACVVFAVVVWTAGCDEPCFDRLWLHTVGGLAVGAAHGMFEAYATYERMRDGGLTVRRLLRLIWKSGRIGMSVGLVLGATEALAHLLK